MVRKITPIPQSMSCNDHGDVTADYSIALEYQGPPIDHSIPWAAPLDFRLIPTADTAALSSPSRNGFTLPVVQPIARSSNMSSGVEIDKFRGKDMALFTRNSEELLRGAVDETESSGTLGFLDSRNHSQELSGSSDMAETPLDSQVMRGFQRYMDSENWNSSELGSTLPGPFAVEVSSSCEEESDEEGLQRRTRRRANATSVGPELGEKMDGEGYEEKYDEEEEEEEYKEEGEGGGEMNPVAEWERRRLPKRAVKKGHCFECNKSNRFREKEACIVCDEKYCCDCVLKAMGSMPEGRKCLDCIGSAIDDSKRKSLGKCSRMLRGLLSKDEVKLIMHYELCCAVNQILPVYVNGKYLSEEELIKLKTCPVPPRRLKPGRYWYDKQSGFWGKEGHKPSQVISHSLEVGNPIRRDASNGDTNLVINGREITKAELWMLKSAGVQCAGVSELWLMPDGSYQELGMNFVEGKKIWGRKRTKIFCTLLSLPTPQHPRLQKETSDHNAEGVVISTDLDHRPLYKILLLGNAQSGSCTIFKQAKIRYNVPFSEEERQSMKLMIQRKLYGYLAVLLEGREYFHEESLVEMRRQAAEQPGPSNYIREEHEKTMYSVDPKLRVFSDWLVSVVVSGNLENIFPAATGDYSPSIELLMKDPAILATCNRINELGLPGVASYFLDKAVEIAQVDYEPSDTDILYAEGICSSHGLVQVDFTFPKTAEDGCSDFGEQSNPVSRCKLVRMQAKTLGEQCKWVEMFEDFNIVLFCVSLSDYDENEVDNNGGLVNKMMANKSLFETIVTNPSFSNMTFLLILNKIDLLNRVEQVPLNECEWFNDFTVVPSRNHGSKRNNGKDIDPHVQRAFHYVALKFKRLFKSLTGRNLYVWPATGLEQDSVDGAMRYAREIMRWEEEKANLSLSFNGMSSEIMDSSCS